MKKVGKRKGGENKGERFLHPLRSLWSIKIKIKIKPLIIYILGLCNACRFFPLFFCLIIFLYYPFLIFIAALFVKIFPFYSICFLFFLSFCNILFLPLFIFFSLLTSIFHPFALFSSCLYSSHQSHHTLIFYHYNFHFSLSYISITI